MAHLYLMTLPIEGVDHNTPTLRAPTCWSTGEEVGGFVMGGYERQPARSA